MLRTNYNYKSQWLELDFKKKTHSYCSKSLHKVNDETFDFETVFKKSECYSMFKWKIQFSKSTLQKIEFSIYTRPIILNVQYRSLTHIWLFSKIYEPFMKGGLNLNFSDFNV